MAGRPRTRTGSYNIGPRQRAAGYRRRQQRLIDDWSVARGPDQRLAAAIRAMTSIAAQPAPNATTEDLRTRVLDETAAHLRRAVEQLCAAYEKEVMPK